MHLEKERCVRRRQECHGPILFYLSFANKWKLENQEKNRRWTIRAKKTRLYAKSIADTVREPLVILDEDLRVVAAGRRFYHQFQLSGEHIEGCRIYELDNGRWDIPELRRLLEEIVPERGAVEDFELRYRFETIGERVMLLNARRLDGEGSGPALILLAIEDITRRSDAQENLERNSAMLEALLDSIPEGILITDANHVVKRISRHAGELFGLPPEKLMYTDEPARLELLQLYWPTGERIERPNDLPLSKAAITGETYTNYEVTLKRDGVTRTLSANASPVRDSRGAVIGAIGGWRDITERKRIEEELRRRTAQLEATINSIPAGYIVYRPDRSIRHMNEFAEQMLGFSEEERNLSYNLRIALLQVQMPTGEPFPIERIPSNRAFGGETVRNEKMKIVRPNRHLWLSVSAAPIIAGDSSMFGVVMEFADITEEVRIQEALRRSEEKYRAIFEQAAVGIARVGFDDARWIDVNAAFCRMLGYSAEEFKATPWPEITHPDDIESDLISFKQMSAGELNGYSVEKRFIHKTGHHVWARLTLSLVRDEQGKPDYEVAIIEDIRERKQAEEDLQRRTKELVAANRNLEAFSYSVSHDLRNPVHTIGVFADILAEEYAERLDGEGRDYLRRIDAGVKKMQAIIDNMLSLSRIGRQEVRREDVNLSALVWDFLQELKNTNPDRQVECIVQQNVLANADPRLVHPALVNLLRNAWKFTAKQEVGRIEFGIAGGKDNNTAYFVRDNGVGFDMQFAKKIFEPFKRVHSEREFGGTGVGLSIVQRAIERHGGEIRAEGEIGNGATFYFTL